MGVESVNEVKLPTPCWNIPPFFVKMVSLNLSISNRVKEHADNERMNFSEALRHLIHLGYIYRYVVMETDEYKYKKRLQELEQKSDQKEDDIII